MDLVLSDRFVDLIDDGFEAIFRIGPAPDSNLLAIELAPFRTIACASPAYLRERGTPVTPSDLADHECVTFANWPEPSISPWRFMGDDGPFEAAVRGRLTVNNAAALLQAALAGFGVVLIAEDWARPHLTAGRLVRVVAAYDTPSRPIHLLVHPDRRQTPKLRRFIDRVVEDLGPASIPRP